ncbi:MAG: hypothetical protein ABJN51_18045, partial [Sneathiella sp.]
MTAQPYTRLRQVCLATLDLHKHETALSRILDIQPCHKSKLDEFGLENSLFAIGGSFIELVAPIQENTAVHRFLDRTGGIGGYMAIFDCENTQIKKETALRLGIPPVHEREGASADLLQLNPKATGLTLVEFDHHKGGTDRFDAYEWAGDTWQDYINQTVIEDIAAFTFQCTDPKEKANLWAALTGKAAEHSVTESRIALDYGDLFFTAKKGANAPECFSGLRIKTTNKSSILKRATAEGYEVTENGFGICGV